MRWGRDFPDMTEAYSPTCAASPKQVAAELCVPLGEGVYAAMLGPSYETPPEIRYLRAIGADVVGMSTVPEAIAANHMGITVLGISCVTNMAAGILPQKINHEEVLETGATVRDTLVQAAEGALTAAGGGSMDDPLLSAALARARACLRTVFQLPGRRGARGFDGQDSYRLQRRKCDLRADRVRRTRGDVQSDHRRRRASSGEWRWSRIPTT